MSRSTSSTRSRFLGVLVVLALVAVGVAGLAGTAQAVTYYWDATSPIETAGFGTASGTWGTDANWSASNAGTDATGVVLTATTDDLNFGYLTDGLAAGTVTVTGTVDAQSLTFASGSGAIVLSGGTAINLAAVATITTDNASDTISSALTGAGTSLIKTGAGILTLSGANTFTGQLSVQSGTLAIGTINNVSADGTLGNSTSSVILGNTGGQTGTLQYTGATAGSTKPFTMANGGTGAFQVDTAGTTLTLSGAIDGDGAMTKTGSGTLTLSGTNSYTGGTTISNGTLQFTKLVSMPASGAVAVNTGTTLAVNVGGTGEWTTGTTGEGTIGGLLAGLGGQSGGTVSYSGNVTLGLQVTGTQTYSGNIGNVGSSLALSKSGSGSLTLSGTNTFSGGLVVSGGTLVASADTNLGAASGGMTFNGTCTFGNDGSWTVGSGRTITVSAGANVTFNFGGATFAGPVVGSGTFTVSKPSQGNPGLSLTNTNNTFTGAMNLGDKGASGYASYTFNSLGDASGAGIISLGYGGQGAYFIWGTGASAPLVLNYRQFDIGGSPGSFITNNNTASSHANTITINTDLLFTGAGSRTLTLGGTNTGANTIAGKIPNGPPGTVISLTKADASTWTLSGTNTYSGGTTLSAGTLNANAASALGAGNVTVSAGTLVIGAADAMADAAALRLPSAAAKNLTMNFNDTVGSLFLGGVPQPNNTYTSSGLGIAWMNPGSGILTVGSAAAQPRYWDLDGETPGAGSTAGDATGTWNATAKWNSLADGSGPAAPWSAGAVPTFAAGTDASGTYAVTVEGTQEIGGLTFEEGNVTLSPGTTGDGLRMTADSLAYVNTGLTATIATPISQDATARALTKIGAGTLVLSGANAYAGTTTVSAGTLRLSHADAIGGTSGNLIVQGGGVVADTTVNLSSLTFTGANNTNVSGGTLAFGTGGSINQTVINQQHTITSAITGSPTVNIAFNGNKSYPGGVAVYQGLTFAPTSGTVTLGIANVPPLNAGGDKAGLWLGGTTTGNSVQAVRWSPGADNHYGSLWKKDSGTWTVGNVDIGACVIDGGTLVVNGTLKVYYSGFFLQSGGTLAGTGTINPALSVPTGAAIAPGDPAVAGGVGTLKASTNVTMNNGAKYEWQIGAGATDILNITSGKLDLDNFVLKIFDAGGSVTSGAQLPVFTYAATGVTIDMAGFGNTGANFDTTALGSGWTIGTLALTNDAVNRIIYLTGLSTTVLGDTNGDKVVDAADYIAIKTNFGLTGLGITRLQGDLVDNDVVDWADLQELMNAMGTRSVGDAPAAPEPATLGLLAIGALAVIRRRRRS